MNVLGNAGSIYMVVLIFLLIAGLGLIINGLLQMIIGTDQKKKNQRGGGFMQNQTIGWLKLSIISFIGMIIGLILLSFISPYGTYGTSVGGTYVSCIESMTSQSMNNMMRGGAPDGSNCSTSGSML